MCRRQNKTHPHASLHVQEATQDGCCQFSQKTYAKAGFASGARITPEAWFVAAMVSGNGGVAAMVPVVVAVGAGVAERELPDVRARGLNSKEGTNECLIASPKTFWPSEVHYTWLCKS